MFLFNGREAHSRSFVKAVSWRVLGSIDTFLLSLLFTRNVGAAGAIATTEVHERVWAGISWGLSGDTGQTAEAPKDSNT
mgnify:CR=1 FL=1